MKKKKKGALKIILTTLLKLLRENIDKISWFNYSFALVALAKSYAIFSSHTGWS